jgi:hypothetical protein
MKSRTIYRNDGTVRAEYVDGQLVRGAEGVEVDRGPMIMFDLPDYVSPTTGKLISGRVQRKADLAQSGCRPYEGIAAEQKEVQRQQVNADKQMDRLAEKMTMEAWHRMPDHVRRQLSD